MKILQKIKSLFNCSVIPPEHIFNGIGIEYITPIKKSRDKPDEVQYYFMIHFQSGLVIKVQIYTSEIEVPPSSVYQGTIYKWYRTFIYYSVSR